MRKYQNPAAFYHLSSKNAEKSRIHNVANLLQCFCLSEQSIKSNILIRSKNNSINNQVVDVAVV